MCLDVVTCTLMAPLEFLRGRPLELFLVSLEPKLIEYHLETRFWALELV